MVLAVAGGPVPTLQQAFSASHNDIIIYIFGKQKEKEKETQH